MNPRCEGGSTRRSLGKICTRCRGCSEECPRRRRILARTCSRAHVDESKDEAVVVFTQSKTKALYLIEILETQKGLIIKDIEEKDDRKTHTRARAHHVRFEVKQRTYMQKRQTSAPSCF